MLGKFEQAHILTGVELSLLLNPVQHTMDVLTHPQGYAIEQMDGQLTCTCQAACQPVRYSTQTPATDI